MYSESIRFSLSAVKVVCEDHIGSAISVTLTNGAPSNRGFADTVDTFHVAVSGTECEFTALTKVYCIGVLRICPLVDGRHTIDRVCSVVVQTITSFLRFSALCKSGAFFFASNFAL